MLTTQHNKNIFKLSRISMNTYSEIINYHKPQKLKKKKSMEFLELQNQFVWNQY